ncbi:MAG: excinuclease ABC subunit UvrC [Ruminococcaceae bacterium]|nr:excinuclease ABC subunit UvrC [Oscillospiraceae bacterium]
MTNERLEYLRKKAGALPRTPGIYIMKDKNGKVIYVGKSRSLRDRVSQYFHLASDANLKTLRMVSFVEDFETVFCDTEIEALTLENVKIKQYNPKYNILLKDSKSYPYIKLTMNEQYPRLSMTRKRLADGAKYFGPYSGASVVYNVLGVLERSLSIPMCKRSFPRDIGKERPCIYKQMGRCIAPCDNSITQENYYKTMQCAADVLRGNIKEAVTSLTAQMYKFAENECFEDAARCRDGIESLKKLRDGQKVVGAPDDEYDIIAVYSDNLSTCISVFYIRSGIISDSDNFIYGASELTGDSGYEYMSSFLTELYSKREYIPSEILLAFDYDKDELELVQEYIRTVAKRAIKIRIPQKGDSKKLCDMVALNALEQAKQYKNKMEQDTRVLSKLSQMLGLDGLPERIEAYDISNLGNEHITAGMIVAENGKLKKSDYRVFKIKDQNGADDYAAMTEVILRRMSHLNDSTGSFAQMPDLILLDGGMTHVSVVKTALRENGINVPVFGMVKDEHHKTRTVVTESQEISIAKEQSVFVFVYKLQEEVHRFTVSKMDNSKRKTLKRYSLENVEGIGNTKARALMNHFKTLLAMKEASVEEICKVKGISQKDAERVYEYLKKN